MSNPNRPKSKPKDKSKAKPEAPRGGLIPKRKDWQEAWARLKAHVSGDKEEISDLEKLLLTNDSEALGLDPAEPDYD